MRIYATEEGNGRKHLIALECDDCGVRIKPNPDIATSGWEKSGVRYTSSDNDWTEWHLCPGCQRTSRLRREG